jgi:thioredoxin reductase (NADPH)
LSQKSITIYGADWCPDCRRTKNYLNDKKIPFEHIDVDDSDEASQLVMKINNGKRIIPTVIIDDKVYSNPSLSTLSAIFDNK